MDAGIGWYEDLCAVHGTASVLRDGIWSAVGPPPPLHSGVVVAEPGVPVEQVLERWRATSGGVKDSFSDVDLGAHGFALLLPASWIHRRPHPPVRTLPAGWTVVRGAGHLAAWTAGHDTADVLLPGLLRSAHLVVLEQQVDGSPVAGAVARLGSGTVDVSDVHAAPGHDVDWSELAAVVAHLFPDRPLVGYERGTALAGALAGGFTIPGALRVWVP